MTRLEHLRDELRHETQVARRHLASIPAEHFGWRPHPKSRTIAELGGHFVDCVWFASEIFSRDVTDIDLTSYSPTSPVSPEALLAAFDGAVAEAITALERAADHEATGGWDMRINGQSLFVKPREAAFRDMTLSHLVHHRGQLSVYLRLLDVPVPQSYGPTADHPMMP